VKLVSIVAPFHNEAGGVELFHRELSAALAAVPGHRFEIVCVDDGSSDATLDELVALTARDPRVRVLELSRNFGKEAALTAGMDAARGDAVVALDADLQDPPELIGRLVEQPAPAERSGPKANGTAKTQTATAATSREIRDQKAISQTEESSWFFSRCFL